MKNQKNKSRVLVTALLSITFLFVLSVLAAQPAAAQRKFDVKATGTEDEIKGIAQFAQNLGQFLGEAEQIEKKNSVSEAEINKLQEAGRRIKDGTSNLRQNLQQFIAELKSANQWNEEFDVEFVNAISNSKVKSFFQRNGGARKVLIDALAAINSVNADVEATINEARRSRAANSENEVLFLTASFAPRAAKVRFKCVLIGVGIAAAELAKLKITAENLDNIFDKNCGTGGATTQ